MKPHIVGIAGPSSSGKTELACRLVLELPGTAIVSLDCYYRGRDELPFEEREQLNFDHPDALEWELLREHLQAIAEGRPFEEPLYSFERHVRIPGVKRIEPTAFLIVEGLFVFYWPELRAILDTKVYVSTRPEVCYSRRRTIRRPLARIRRPGGVRRAALRALHSRSPPFAPRHLRNVASGAGLLACLLRVARKAGQKARPT